MYMNCVRRSRRCVREEGRKREERVHIVDLVAWSIRARGGIGLGTWSWQNLAEFGGTWQNIAEFSGTWRNMAEYGRLLSDCRILLLDCLLVVGLWLLSRWKQVDVYKVSRGCPVTLALYLASL